MSEPAACDERAPLLHSIGGRSESAEHHGIGAKHTLPLPNPALLLYLLVMLVVELASPLVDVPMLQIQEEIICQKHYPDVANGADPRCKDDAVQSDLPLLTGWSSSFVLVPGLVTAVPYGYLADKYGQANILRLSIFGMVLWQMATILVCMPIQPQIACQLDGCNYGERDD